MIFLVDDHLVKYYPFWYPVYSKSKARIFKWCGAGIWQLFSPMTILKWREKKLRIIICTVVMHATLLCISLCCPHWNLWFNPCYETWPLTRVTASVSLRWSLAATASWPEVNIPWARRDNCENDRYCTKILQENVWMEIYFSCMKKIGSNVWFVTRNKFLKLYPS